MNINNYSGQSGRLVEKKDWSFREIQYEYYFSQGEFPLIDLAKYFFNNNSNE